MTTAARSTVKRKAVGKAAAAKRKAKAPPAEAILDKFGLEKLCDRLVNGDTQTQICRDLKIAMGSLGRWIALDTERSARVREARIEAARAFEEKATDGIRNAKNAFQLQKARELAHHYRWKASKADPREYGDKLQLDQTTLVVNLSDEEIARRRENVRAQLEVALGQRKEGEAAPAP